MYDDYKYLEEFKSGNYPKIHDDIFHLACLTPAKNVLDLGCCYGLLSDRLSKHFSKVVGVEGNKHYCERAIYDNIINLRIQESSLEQLKTIITDNNVDMVIGRRVLPELYDTGGESLLMKLSNLFYDCNVKYLVIEGRIESKKSVNRLKSIDEEIKIMSDYYSLEERYKRCARLKRKEM